MIPKKQPVIVAIGHETTLIYLLGRFAERSGYRLMVNAENVSSNEVTVVDPAVIIFLSVERLARGQSLVGELAGLDIPILVCSSTLEEARAIELGADGCLLHPLTYDGFETVLTNIVSKRA